MRLLISLLCLFLIAGVISCGNNDKSIAKQAGETVGKNLTDFGKGVGTQIDQSVMVTVLLDDSVNKIGITKTVAKTNFFDATSSDHNSASSSKSVLVYLISSNPVSEKTFRMTALDEKKLEIGRSKVSVSFGKDDAKYVEFSFDRRVDFALMKEFLLSVE